MQKVFSWTKCQLSVKRFNRWRTVVSGTWKYDDPRLNMSHKGAARVWYLQPREVLFPCPTNYRVSYVLSYDQQDFLQDSGVSKGFYPQNGCMGVLPTRWWRFWEFYPQDGGVRDLPTRWRQCRVYEFYPQDGGVSESFSHKMVAWEICLQMAAMPCFWVFYPQDGGVGDLPTRWRRFWEFYPQDGDVRDLPTRWRQCRIDESFTHKMAATIKYLP